MLPAPPENVLNSCLRAQSRQQEAARFPCLSEPPVPCSLPPAWRCPAWGGCLRGTGETEEPPSLLASPLTTEFFSISIIPGRQPCCRETDSLFREEERWGLVRAKWGRQAGKEGEQESKREKQRQAEKQSAVVSNGQSQNVWADLWRARCVCDEAKFVQLIMDHVQSIHFLSLQLVLSVLGLIALHAFL